MRKRTFLAWIGLFLLAACGKKGPLIPPIPRLPKPARELAVIQRGRDMLLSWRNPMVYIDGRPLEDIAAVEIWWMKEDKPKDSEPLPVDGAVFVGGAGLLREIDAAGLAGLKEADGAGGTILRFRHLIDPADLGAKRYAYALKVRDGRGKTSEFTGIVVKEPRPAPLPPGGLTATVGQKRILLEWKAPEKNIDSSTPPELAGYLVYRASGDGLPHRLNSALLTKTSFEDLNFVFGEKYRYLVRASANPVPPFLESEDSEPLVMEARDTFPPQAPKDLTLIAGADFVSLSWSANREKDLAGYRIWRRVKGESDFVLLTPEAFQETAHFDRTAEKEVRYEYAVTAVDAFGNESPKSKTAEALILGEKP
jgi:hypothetical protein